MNHLVKKDMFITYCLRMFFQQKTLIETYYLENYLINIKLNVQHNIIHFTDILYLKN